MRRVQSDPEHSGFFSAALAIVALFGVGFATACGGASSTPTPVLSGNTQVAVALTSTANDQLSEFDLVLNTMTLTSKSGKTVSLLSTPQGFEFTHLNGQLAPGFTVTVPQDIYTSATATVGGAEFACATYVSGSGLTTSTYNYGYTPDSNVTVNVPSPITITGSNMGLAIDLQVLQSATFPSTCWVPDASWSITPTFNVTPAVFSSQPTNPENGKVFALDGEIIAIAPSGNSFTLAVTEGDALTDNVTVSTADSTVYQGLGNFSALTVGTFVDMDGALQPDSSVLASRIAVENTSAVDVVAGPALYVSEIEPALFILGRDQQGSDFSNTYFIGGLFYSFDSAIFQVSGQLTNLQNLPFAPSFTGSNMVPGQNVYLSAPLLTDQSNPYTELYAITLIPQVVNGTVVGSIASGNFTDYSVSLAPYDLFPNLAGQPGQATPLTNPSQVEVYVDSNTQMLNSQALAAGGTFRFYGLVFNDNGTLRMDCAQVNDGVAQTQSQSSRKGHLTTGVSQVLHERIGRSSQVTTVITRHPQP
jgi:hypothetical protein